MGRLAAKCEVISAQALSQKRIDSSSNVQQRFRAISKDGKTMTGTASIPNAQGKPFEASGLFEKQ
jgi:hypothetical protein